ncbi:metal-dependent hydrolase [Ammoniphilus sp. CFH 90114]|uniref:metal-dependent hydrolase n=1 Tax=Ammoniphilus sp. CFH 90114 TaxID=2493665 RepID=UPI00100FE474|nr:metal-dependent hydrolase [Ammoniphilus sp. CFH 90114]RXT04804.1 metal-dependent hydrolase [Ammoniphilus sp. CFH 90114]
MEILFHGHSTVQITRLGKSLIIDPFITNNPLAKTKAADVKVDYILLTHGHSDHMDDVLTIAKANNATVIATHELATYFSWQGIEVHGMNTGGSRTFDFGKVKFTQAFHSSGLTFADEQKIIYAGMPCGLLLTIDNKVIYHAGDTGLFGDMKILGELNCIDLAFLPIGDNFTMGPEDALIAAEWIRAKKVVPIHYNTFGLIKQDGHAFVEKLRAKGLDGLVAEPGDVFSLN